MANDVTELHLNDTIDEKHITSKSFIAGLKAVKTPNVDLHIDSEGGDILDGFAIYNAIKAHEGHVTAHIGLAASIASVIACAADKVCIAKNGYVMIHDGMTKATGNPTDLRQEADVLEKFCNTIAQAYADKSAKTGKNKTAADFRAAMGKETWLTADEAMAWGLVDEIEDGGDDCIMAVSAMLAVASYEHAPPALRRFAAKLARAERETGKERPMDKIVNRDGKWYHGEVEVDASDCVSAAKPVAQAPSKPEVQEDAVTARATAIAEGAKQAREYRAMFNIVVASAKLDAAASADFEKKFYGRAESDLKFLASHAIGQRAQAVGESTPGNGEGETLTAEATAVKEVEAECISRWKADARLRRMHGCHANDEGDPTYKSRLERYIAAEKKCRKDQAHAGKVGEEVESTDDSISRVMRTRSELVK
jgi:ATP-dependent protease ClpP protease subunit